MVVAYYIVLFTLLSLVAYLLLNYYTVEQMTTPIIASPPLEDTCPRNIDKEVVRDLLILLKDYPKNKQMMLNYIDSDTMRCVRTPPKLIMETREMIENTYFDYNPNRIRDALAEWVKQKWL